MKISNKIPLFFPLIFLLLGIIYQEVIPSNFYLLSLSIILNIFLLLKSKNKYLAYCLIFLSGAFLLQNQKNNSKEILNKVSNKKLNIIATVINKENLTSNNIKEEITLKVNQLKESNKKTNTNFNILCYTYTPTKIIPGQKIEIKNVEIKEVKNNDFKDYLIKEGIISSFFSKKLNFKILNKNINPIKQFIYKTRKKIYLKIKQKLSKNSFSYFSSIFLGNKKNEISSKQKNIFNIWGISHYLARSGLHIVIFIFIWKLFLSLIPISIKLKNIFIFLILLIYLALSWPNLSFFRAFFIFALYLAGTLFNKQTNFSHILIVICILILIKNPIQLFFLDFQLTFLLTFALSISNKKF